PHERNSGNDESTNLIIFAFHARVVPFSNAIRVPFQMLDAENIICAMRHSLIAFLIILSIVIMAVIIVIYVLKNSSQWILSDFVLFILRSISFTRGSVALEGLISSGSCHSESRSNV
ncbi:hypothetical protein, partial [Bacteroides caecimuris]|uniref:hypothetical protein n=1 Tax=Bacteroides caecimuris TaxID=1796613 RepID=UPI0025B77F25